LIRQALRAALEQDAARCRPIAQLGVLIASANGAESADCKAVYEMINPYDQMILKCELITQFSPRVAGYLLTLKNLPQWVRDIFPLSHLWMIADRDVNLPPGYVGVFGSPDVFACYCKIDGGHMSVGLFAMRKPELAGQVHCLKAWDHNSTIQVRLPHITAGSNIMLEVVSC